jgi:hypothetical protein
VVVAGIMQSLKPSVEIGMGVALAMPGPEELTKVVIIKDGTENTATLGSERSADPGPERRAAQTASCQQSVS